MQSIDIIRASNTKNITSKVSDNTLINISSSGEISNGVVELNTANTLVVAEPYKKYPPMNVIKLEKNINVITKNIVASS